MQKLISPLLKNQLKIKKGFFYLSAFLAAAALFGSYLIYSRHAWTPEIFEAGTQIGKMALIFYTLTLIPGIAQRIGIANPLISLLMIFRRQLGVLTYILVFTHFMYVRGAFTLMTMSLSDRPNFELMGLYAFFALTPLFLTSTDLAVKLLGKWWKRLHRLTYLALALVFFHVALQDLSKWTVLAMVMLTLEAGSWIYYYKKRRPKKAAAELQS